jgi:hypothetical protein
MGHYGGDGSLLINIDIFTFYTQLLGDLLDGDTKLVVIVLHASGVEVLLYGLKANVLIDE